LYSKACQNQRQKELSWLLQICKGAVSKDVSNGNGQTGNQISGRTIKVNPQLLPFWIQITIYSKCMLRDWEEVVNTKYRFKYLNI
jgi:hypothetical protein